MWVRSEYAGELAVLATWLTALLPWSVSVVRPSPNLAAQFTVVNVRFVFFQFHYLYGLPSADQSLTDAVQVVTQVPAFVPGNQTLEAWVWVAGAGLFAVLLALSLVYYAREGWLVARVPVDLVRVFGGIFALLAVTFSVATLLFFEHQLTVPVGTLFMWLFAVTLLRVDRS